MVYKQGLIALSGSSVLNLRISCFIRVQLPVMPVSRVTLSVIAVINLATALVSVSFSTQPAELELTIPSVSGDRHSLSMHGLPTAEPVQGPGPEVVLCGLQVCRMSLRPQPCMQQVEQGLAHSHSRVQAERPSCQWRLGAGAWPSGKGPI